MTGSASKQRSSIIKPQNIDWTVRSQVGDIQIVQNEKRDDHHEPMLNHRKRRHSNKRRRDFHNMTGGKYDGFSVHSSINIESSI